MLVRPPVIGLILLCLVPLARAAEPKAGEKRPLAGRDKPYGRVFNDPFYGRVAFSPDGKKLAFVADDGRDPRSPEEAGRRRLPG